MDTARPHRIVDQIAGEDLQFLMKTELLEATPDYCKLDLLARLCPVHVKAGHRLILQGTSAQCMYLIQKGSAMVSLDKTGQAHPMARLGPGEVVGEIAIVTGENRTANVDAETDLLVWALTEESYEELCRICPEFNEFLIHLATERLCSQTITAEKSIGRYTVDEVVAEGGWSIVYKGVHSFLNLPVAIKMLKHSMARDSDFLSQFQNEAKIIASLNHENIVKVYDVEHVYRTVFIVMEYLEGATLRHLLRRRLRLPFPKVLEILLQVSKGLDYAHKKGIVHQDVKPGNIFIEKGNRVKLVDFGLATPIGHCSADMPGTAFYMAPEQIECDPVDARTDIYSLGITAYEMATGVKPFPEDVCEVLRAHVTTPMPDPRELNPDLPEAFSSFLAKATRKDPADRYQNMGELMSDLRAMTEKPAIQAPVSTHTRRRMMGLFMFYTEDRQLELNRALAAFSEQLQGLGAELRVADFEDVW